MTIGQQIKWNFKTNGNLEIKDKNGNPIYFEDSNGYWVKRERDSNGRTIYHESSDGDWIKWEYDSQGKVIYIKDSKGYIVDKRPKPCENKEIVIDGEKFKLVKV